MLLIYPIILILLLTEFTNSAFDAIFKLILYSLLIFTSYSNSDLAKSFFTKSTAKYMLPIYTIMAVFIIASIRTNNQELGLVSSAIRFVKLILFFLLTLSFFKILINKKTRRLKSLNLPDSIYTYIIVVPTLFIFINLVLYCLGIDLLNNSQKGLDPGNSVILEYLLGLGIPRANFPLVTTGINNYGIFVGGIAVLSLTSMWSSRTINSKFIAIICLFICSVTLILLDTRSALIMSISSAVFTIILFKTNKINLAIPIIIFGATIPLLLLLTSNTILDNPILSSLSRGEDDLSTGNNRLAIWLKVGSELVDVKPIHLIGYGEFGQVGSGLSASWSGDFSTFYNASYITTHNVIFQLILDSGYIGLFIFFYFILSIVNRISKVYKLTSDKNLSIFISFFVYFLLAGGTEAHYTHVLSFNLMWYLSIGAFVIMLNYTHSRKPFYCFQNKIDHESTELVLN